MRHHETRPPAGSLASVMLDQGRLDQGKLRLSEWARRHLVGRTRCPRHHLVAACVQTVDGVWGLAPTGLFGDDRWRAQWWDEIADPAAVRGWCRCPGRRSWTLDLTDFRNPRLVR